MGYGLIFDMDGVIIDSNPYHKVTWQGFLRKHGIHCDDHVFKNHIAGRPGTSSIPDLFGIHLSEQVINEYMDEVDGTFQETMRQAKDVKPPSGLISFLKSIKAAGHQTALATSAPTMNVDLILEKLQLRPYFDVILDKTDVTNGKPDPEVYLTTVDRLGIQKDQCLVFEDSKAGIRAALAAGLRVVGVTGGHSGEELLSEGVTMAIDDFTEITLDNIVKLLQ
jgi:beta-phosphoglucomutase